jgi:hypothetical protein
MWHALLLGFGFVHFLTEEAQQAALQPPYVRCYIEVRRVLALARVSQSLNQVLRFGAGFSVQS